MSENLSYPKIEIVGDSPKKRDFCVMPTNGENILMEKLLSIEEELEREDLTREQWDDNVVAHMRIWNSLSLLYKSEMADLTAMRL